MVPRKKKKEKNENDIGKLSTNVEGVCVVWDLACAREKEKRRREDCLNKRKLSLS